MNLSDLFEETTTGAGVPASRLSADDVYRAGRRRRRIGLAARAGLVVLPVVALVAALVAVVVPPRDDEVADPPRSRWVVHAVGGFTEQRLWAYVEPCAGCGLTLQTSDDGGRTWTGFVVDVAEMDQLTMTTASGGVALLRHPSSVRVGATGWGVFRHVDYSVYPVMGAPLDSPVHCNPARYGQLSYLPPHDVGTVRVVDIPGARYGPTPTQPPFTCLAAVRAPDGVIVVAGHERFIGRAAVARSLDNGSTWTWTLVEPAQDKVPDGDLTVVDLLATAGGGAVVALRQGSWSGLYRYDAGLWSELSIPGRLPDALVLGRDNTLVAEFLHGVAPHRTEPSGPPPVPAQPAAQVPTVAVPAGAAAFTANRPGSVGFQPISRPRGIGREAILGSVALPGGGHVAYNNAHIWTSSDGRVWKPVRLG